MKVRLVKLILLFVLIFSACFLLLREVDFPLERATLEIKLTAVSEDQRDEGYPFRLLHTNKKKSKKGTGEQLVQYVSGIGDELLVYDLPVSESGKINILSIQWPNYYKRIMISEVSVSTMVFWKKTFLIKDIYKDSKVNKALRMKRKNGVLILEKRKNSQVGEIRFGNRLVKNVNSMRDFSKDKVALAVSLILAFFSLLIINKRIS